MDLHTDSSILESFRFFSYLNSNYIPSDEEIHEIKAFLVEPIKQAHDVENELNRLQTELDALKTKKDNIWRQVDACGALITPARRIPNDVLGEIFYQSLPTNRNASISKQAPPLIFTRVCRQWRQVALSSPRLWETIHIHVREKPRNPWTDPTPNIFCDADPVPGKWDEHRAGAAFEWLRRSGTRPLHISLVEDLALPKFLSLYLDSIIPFASRWKSVFLQPSSGLISQMATIEAQDLPLLQSLFIYGPRNKTNTQEGQVPLGKCGLFKAESLRKLSIRQRMIDVTLLNVNWSALTHLELGSPTRHNFTGLDMCVASDVLRYCTRLVYCLVQIDIWGGRNDNIPIMRLPLLQQLSILTDSNIELFIEKLEASKLREVTFCSTGENERNHVWLASLLQIGTIQRLSIDSLHLPHTSFIHILQQCPGLVSLSVKQTPIASYHPLSVPDRFWIDDQFLAQASDNTSDGLCHQLEEFKCDYIGDFSVNGMMEFIRRKQDGSVSGLAKLKKISILNIPSKPGKYDKKTKELKEHSSSDQFRSYVMDGLVFELDKVEEEKDGDESYDSDYEGDPPINFGDSAIQYAECWAD